MKLRHKAIWEELGSFSLIFNNSIKTSTNFMRYFIFTNSFAELNDWRITIMAVMAKILFAMCTAVFAFNLYQNLHH